MIRIEGLTRKFEEVTALNNVTLNVSEGEIFGLLGPNGAGKSTLINILCGLLRPGSGKVSIADFDILKDQFRIKRMIGIVPQELAIYSDLSARDNVKFFAGLYGLKGQRLKQAVDQALEFCGLQEVAGKYPRTFSGGMKRRLNIACGIAHEPRLIFLDEPTVGIDPQSRNHILESVRQLNRQGATLIYTTHYMEEAELLCSRIGIIDHGKVIALGTTAELQSLVKDKERLVVTMKDGVALDLSPLERIQGVLAVHREGTRVSLDIARGVNNIGTIITCFTNQDIPLVHVEMDAPHLEMVFLSLTGRKLRDQEEV